jgi:hypothetical protein
MPKATTKTRQELRSRFVRNAIPTEADFADLIAASLNLADDGLLKLPDQPVSLVRQKADQPVLRLFADPAVEGAAWQMQLIGTDKPGLALANQAGTSALFLDGATGNVGLGTASPQGKLTISEATGTTASATTGSLLIDHENSGGASSIVFRSKVDRGSDYAFMEYRDKNPSVNDTQAGLLTIGIQNETNDHLALMPSGNVGIGTTTPGQRLTVEGIWSPAQASGNDLAYAGILAIRSNVPQLDFIDTDTNANDWAIHVNSSKMFFIRSPWDDSVLVLDGTGNVGIGTASPQGKLTISEATGTNASATTGSLLIDHENSGGASSIVFRSKVDRGSDYAFMEYRDKNLSVNDTQAGLLTIGIQNEANDHLALMPSGNVGINTTTPNYKLHVKGTAGIGGQVEVLTDSNPIRFSSEWTGFASIKHGVDVNNAEISNDTNNYKCLMIAGNKSAKEAGDGRRKVAICDDLTVYGTISSQQNIKHYITKNDYQRTSERSFTQCPDMLITFTLQTKAWVLVVFKGGGVNKVGSGKDSVCFSLTVGEGKGDYAEYEFITDQQSAQDATLVYFGELEKGTHTAKAQWLVTGENKFAAISGGKSSRSLMVIQLA